MVDIEVARDLVPVGSTITTGSFGISDGDGQYEGVVLDHLSGPDHGFDGGSVEKVCNYCTQFPGAVYILYQTPIRQIAYGVHFFGEQDPRPYGRRITNVIRVAPK